MLSHPDGARKNFKNKEETKEEWKSYITSRTEAQSKVAQLQKDINTLRTKQFAQMNDQTLKDQIQEKEFQLRVRQKDLEIIDLQMKLFQMVTKCVINDIQLKENVWYRRPFKANLIDKHCNIFLAMAMMLSCDQMMR